MEPPVIEWMLLEHIRSVRGRAQERLAAAFAEPGFVERARDAVPELVAAMEDPVPEVRIRAERAAFTPRPRPARGRPDE